jgi:hypothetical protein
VGGHARRGPGRTVTARGRGSPRALCVFAPPAFRWSHRLS